MDLYCNPKPAFIRQRAYGACGLRAFAATNRFGFFIPDPGMKEDEASEVTVN